MAEAMHASATPDMENLMAAVADEVNRAWAVTPKAMILTQSAPRFEP